MLPMKSFGLASCGTAIYIVANFVEFCIGEEEVCVTHWVICMGIIYCKKFAIHNVIRFQCLY